MSELSEVTSDEAAAGTAAAGRTFAARRTVQLGDVNGAGRLRLDAAARYLQDVATDDAADVGLAEGWVLRRLELRITAFPSFRDVVDLVTWCSGIAASAAERRTTVSVAGRPVIEAVALWVFVAPDGRPVRIDRERFAPYGIAFDRRISTRLRLDDPAGAPGAQQRAWPLRAVDVDVWQHVNNAVSLAALEDVVVATGVADAPAPWAVEVEYRAVIDPDDAPELVWARDGDRVAGALRSAGITRSTFALRPAAPNLESRL